MRMWTPLGRYLRLLGSLARYTLYREMAFRGNFLVKVSVEVLWLAIMVAFYRTVFARTSTIAGWTEPQYFFFVGCFFAMNGIIEMFFLDNCNEFAELVRTGDLDGLLVKPIDEQFLITCRRIDWGTAPNVLMGGAVMGIALLSDGLAIRPGAGRDLSGLGRCGTAIAYSFMLLLTSVSVWMVQEPELDGDVVAVFERGAIPTRDFRRALGRPGHVFHILHADPDRRECASECDGARARRAGRGRDDRRGRGVALALPAVLSVLRCARIEARVVKQPSEG